MVYVLDVHKKPLMPCTEKRARLLLERGRTLVHKMAPFTIRLKDRLVENSVLQQLDLKIDPGSKATGGAVIRDNKEAIGCFEVHHRTNIKDKMDARRSQHRNRRNRKTGAPAEAGHRKPRFNNQHPEKCAACGKNAKHDSGAPARRVGHCRPCAEARRFVDNVHRDVRPAPSLQARGKDSG